MPEHVVAAVTTVPVGTSMANFLNERLGIVLPAREMSSSFLLSMQFGV